jgi:hypothetical protein
LAAKILIPVLLLLAACAQPVVPTGGDKDAQPPRLTQIKISRGTSTEVQLGFDENVGTNQPEQRIVVSPSFTKKPTFKTTQHGLLIRIDTTMPDNFHLQFLSGAISDINEKNDLKDTIIYFQQHGSLDSVPKTFYHAGKVKSSYTLEKIKNISIYRGIFPNIPTTLTGLPYTRTNEYGNYLLPVFDSTESQLLFLKDVNDNHRVDSGEYFHVSTTIKPTIEADTNRIYYLSSDLPIYNPNAEHIYCGYRIYGFKGHSLHTPNELPTISSNLTHRPLVSLFDTVYLLSDSLNIIPFKPLYNSQKNLIPKQTSVKYSVNHQFIPNTRIAGRYHIAFSKPIKQASSLQLLSPSDTTFVNVDIKSEGPFLLTLDAPSADYNTVSIPDSAIQFTDLSYFKKQQLTIPKAKDSVTVTFSRRHNDTAYYLIQVRTKNTTFHIALDSARLLLRLPLDEYSFLIIHDSDRNGYVTPALRSPFKPQEYHYTISNYLLRKGIDTEETIQPEADFHR